MKLYLLRHGHSPSLSEAGVAADALRPLSAAGREAVKRMARELARRGGAPSLILHSPLLRAVESAAAARPILEPGQGAELFPPLENELPPAELLDSLLRRCQNVKEVLAVGHQPQLGELAAHLTGAIHELRPGGLIAIELSGPRFLWSANPDELKQE